jgi:hypothetical protein
VFVARQLGHANPSITLRVYAHLFDSEAQSTRMRDALEARFGGNAGVTSNGKERGNTGTVTLPKGRVNERSPSRFIARDRLPCRRSWVRVPSSAP